MKSNYLVIDDEFNQENYPGNVGLVFAVPPSYAKVTQTDKPADFESIWDM